MNKKDLLKLINKGSKFLKKKKNSTVLVEILQDNLVYQLS